MVQSELVQEAKSGLNEYRQSLIAELQDNIGEIDTERIRNVLKGLGLMSSTPLLTIPYTQDALKRVVAIQTEESWTDPATTELLREALMKRERLDEGYSVYEVNFPTPFHSSSLDVAIVIDDVEENTKLFGATYSKGLAIARAAHEITHSAFANLDTISFSSHDGETVEATEKTGISQATVVSTLTAGAGSTPEYNPSWINEAVCDSVASDAREVIFPESRPDKARVMTLDWQNAFDVEIPAKYLIYSDMYPEQPGCLATTDAIGIDVLAAKRPWLMPQIKKLSAGKLAVSAFHNTLRNSIGTELYTAITERRPVSNWYSILEQIRGLT